MTAKPLWKSCSKVSKSRYINVKFFFFAKPQLDSDFVSFNKNLAKLQACKMQLTNFQLSPSVLSSPGIASVKNTVPLSPLKPPSADSEQGVEKNSPTPGKDPQSPHISMETSNLRPQTPRAEVEPEDEDEASSPLTISELAYRFAELHI